MMMKLTCEHCRYRVPDTAHCTMHSVDLRDLDCCPEFRHYQTGEGQHVTRILLSIAHNLEAIRARLPAPEPVADTPSPDPICECRLEPELDKRKPEDVGWQDARRVEAAADCPKCAAAEKRGAREALREAIKRQVDVVCEFDCDPDENDVAAAANRALQALKMQLLVLDAEEADGE